MKRILVLFLASTMLLVSGCSAINQLLGRTPSDGPPDPGYSHVPEFPTFDNVSFGEEAMVWMPLFPGFGASITWEVAIGDSVRPGLYRLSLQEDSERGFVLFNTDRIDITGAQQLFVRAESGDNVRSSHIELNFLMTGGRYDLTNFDPYRIEYYAGYDFPVGEITLSGQDVIFVTSTTPFNGRHPTGAGQRQVAQTVERGTFVFVSGQDLQLTIEGDDDDNDE
jgi:hypothetical protein